MNSFSIVAMRASALISPTMRKMRCGKVRNSVKVATTLAKLAMGPNRINARLVVLMVLAGRHSIESPRSVNAAAQTKWLKSMEYATSSAL